MQHCEFEFELRNGKTLVWGWELRVAPHRLVLGWFPYQGLVPGLTG